MPLLEAEHLGIVFGGLHALEGVSFRLEENQIIGLIGLGGTGKTIIFNLLTQAYQPTEGTIELEGKNIIDRKTYDVTRDGIARIFQNIRLFKDISVLDNMRIATNYQVKRSVLAGILCLPSHWKEEHAVIEYVMDLLSVFNLQEHTESRAKNLPYGQQRKLEIARAPTAPPKVLLLDEPVADMNSTETREPMESIRLIRDRSSISILLIEHDMNFIMGIYQHPMVLDYDRVIAKGSAGEIRTNPKVIAACLGRE